LILAQNERLAAWLNTCKSECACRSNTGNGARAHGVRNTWANLPSWGITPGKTELNFRITFLGLRFGDSKGRKRRKGGARGPMSCW